MCQSFFDVLRGVTEQLKVERTIEWVRRVNEIKMRVEEMLKYK